MKNGLFKYKYGDESIEMNYPVSNVPTGFGVQNYTGKFTRSGPVTYLLEEYMQLGEKIDKLYTQKQNAKTKDEMEQIDAEISKAKHDYIFHENIIKSIVSGNEFLTKSLFKNLDVLLGDKNSDIIRRFREASTYKDRLDILFPYLNSVLKNIENDADDKGKAAISAFRYELSRPNSPIVDAFFQRIIDDINHREANNGESLEDKAEREAHEQELAAKNEDRKRRLLNNTNAINLTNVAVISSLDEFVRNFFEGDKEGSFKSFSSRFLTSIENIVNNLNEEKTLHTTINGNLTNILAKLDENSNSIEKNISEKLDDKSISNLNANLQDIINKEQEQINCLVEQNRILNETNTLLSNKKDQTIVLNSSNDNNSGPSLFDLSWPAADIFHVNKMITRLGFSTHSINV